MASRVVCALVLCALFPPAPIFAGDGPYGGIRLIEGYTYKRSHTFDTINGSIYKAGGVHIEFESGISEGYAADPKERRKYLWFRQQEINGHRVFVALTQAGIGTKWKPETPRSPKRGHILMVTFPQQFGPDDCANFYTEVLNEQEVADVLLMVLTFDPTQ